MSNVWFTSDTHLGHYGIERFREFTSSYEDNAKQFFDSYERCVKKRDTVFFLGDVVFTTKSNPSLQGEYLERLRQLPGDKILIRGNHDVDIPTATLLGVFKEVHGIIKYKKYWLTHAPIHPQELRGKVNLHGHCHYATVCLPNSEEVDIRYLNCCPENVTVATQGEWLINLKQVQGIR